MASINFGSPLLDKTKDTLFGLNFRCASRSKIVITYISYIVCAILIALVCAFSITLYTKHVKNTAHKYEPTCTIKDGQLIIPFNSKE